MLGAAARFIGRAAGRRAQRVASERAMPALAAHADATAREQIAVAEKYPGLRACLEDGVIFLAGGSRVLPMPDLNAITVAQADALVAQLPPSGGPAGDPLRGAGHVGYRGAAGIVRRSRVLAAHQVCCGAHTPFLRGTPATCDVRYYPRGSGLATAGRVSVR